jgi:thioredoxin 1
MAVIKAVTDADFESEVLNVDKPVLVDFWADWCAPCRLVSPILEELNDEHGDKIAFVKMDVDLNPLTPARYEVSSIPTLNVYRNGVVVRRIVGALPKAALVTELREFFA